MIPPEAILQFTDLQKRLLRQVYDQAWREGVVGYVLESGNPEPRPRYPDALRRAVALAPGFRGLNHMAADLSALSISIQEWTDSHAWRLRAGDSVAWAGNQAGYAEAGANDGKIFSWDSEDDKGVCVDCELLATFPPMPLDDWPSAPGDGKTDCSVGCRCQWVLEEPGEQEPVLDLRQQALLEKLTQRQLQTLSDLMSDAAYL